MKQVEVGEVPFPVEGGGSEHWCWLVPFVYCCFQKMKDTHKMCLFLNFENYSLLYKSKGLSLCLLQSPQPCQIIYICDEIG